MTPTKWNQLGIALGNKCNMMCDHCLPSSSIKEDGGLSSAEQDQLVDLINEHRFSELSFTGGEPFLFYTDEMLNILSRLKYRPKVRITTNASFVKLNSKWKTILSDLAPNCIRISYDRFHSKFLGLEYIENLVNECKNQNIDYLIEVSLSNPMEMVELGRLPAWFKQNLRINKVLRAGRAKKTGCYYKPLEFERTVLNVKCPFIAGKDLMFFPGKGITFCCNSLSANSAIPDQGKFFKSPAQMMASPIWSELNSISSLAELVDRAPELALDPVNSEACNLCDSYFSKREKPA